MSLYGTLVHLIDVSAFESLPLLGLESPFPSAVARPRAPLAHRHQHNGSSI